MNYELEYLLFFLHADYYILGAGAIAGIVIGSLVLLIILIVAAVFAVRAFVGRDNVELKSERPRQVVE